MASTASFPAQPVADGVPIPAPSIPAPTPAKKKQPYPFYLGGVAATIAASITHPLDLTKVRLQASGDKRMIESVKKTVRTAGYRGLFDGITGTWMRQMSYSVCRFWAYDESKKLLGATPQSPAWVLATAGAMAGTIAGVVGNPGEVVMVCMSTCLISHAPHAFLPIPSASRDCFHAFVACPHILPTRSLPFPPV
ncbi:mitochondrial carrier domain-containing protein [Boletus reticuloceps]|uniref:Mitochondrial carrier domain-containing protein n=1 Tax=Boletus reticuloceps TaxID=495285 RepID=A0A8I2YFZ2_9AGAM|nr:mitochondrial carrier domain-containing protein [Boletus reticuloceps]